MIQELEKEFIGTGKVRGFKFKQINQTKNGYIYEVKAGKTYYEVFKRKQTPVCIDFVKRIYSETDFKVSYPKENSFGTWAWTCESIEEVEEKLNSFNEIKEDKNE